MPFDETPHEHGGGGGSDRRHDPKIMKEVIAMSDLQLTLNVETANLCQLCTRVALAEHIVRSILENAMKAEEAGHHAAAYLGREGVVSLLKTVSLVLDEHLAKVRSNGEGDQ
jgi:hypothetical protein